MEIVVWAVVNYGGGIVAPLYEIIKIKLRLVVYFRSNLFHQVLRFFSILILDYLKVEGYNAWIRF